VYTEYFHLREMPFTITPDPAYLYLSPRHQEALGHLLYGTGQYGGFVQLTGEVGTGKTTIVRTLLEQKLPDVQLAMIHNPRQNELEFIQSICDELGAAYMPVEMTLKSLIDALNAHLLRTHAEGRRTVLIIDEAQNLDRNVLEQVRLLTNLETHKEKLLRIMLIGQPELIELLARPDLRQLASRITARYHLMPLDERETGEYIRHRLRVAGSHEELFPVAAVREVHRITRGVPRLINILCDRALLGAYTAGQRKVTPEMLRKAAHESLGHDGGTPARVRRLPSPMVWVEGFVIVLALVLAGILLYRSFAPQWRSSDAATAQTAAAQEQPAAAVVPAPSAEMVTEAPSEAPASDPGIASTPTSAALNPEPQPEAEAPAAGNKADLTTLLQSTQPLPVVVSHLIRLWDPTIRIPRGENVCRALSLQRLECYKASGEWGDLQQMNRPAVLSLSTGRGELQNVLLLGLTATEATLDSSQGPLTVSLQDLDTLWTGEFLLLWRRETAEAFVGPASSGETLQWLRGRLAELGGRAPPSNPSTRYDAALTADVSSFQSRIGLMPDGLVGVRTLISLGSVLPGPTLSAGAQP